MTPSMVIARFMKRNVCGDLAALYPEEHARLGTDSETIRIR
jgi:hypothetical protein